MKIISETIEDVKISNEKSTGMKKLLRDGTWGLFEVSDDDFDELNVEDVWAEFDMSTSGNRDTLLPSIQSARDILDRDQINSSTINLTPELFAAEERRVHFNDICESLQNAPVLQEMASDDTFDFHVESDLDLILVPTSAEYSSSSGKVDEHYSWFNQTEQAPTSSAYSSATITKSQSSSNIKADEGCSLFNQGEYTKSQSSVRSERSSEQKREKKITLLGEDVSIPTSNVLPKVKFYQAKTKKNISSTINSSKVKLNQTKVKLDQAKVKLNQAKAETSIVKTKLKISQPKVKIQKSSTIPLKPKVLKKGKMIQPKVKKQIAKKEKVRVTIPDIQIEHTTLHDGEATIKVLLSQNVNLLTIVAHQSHGHTFSAYYPMGGCRTRKTPVNPTVKERILRQIRNIESAFCVADEKDGDEINK